MGWRQAASLRRIHPGRQATTPDGSATVWAHARLALAVLLCLAAAGCAPHDSSTDDNRPGGFYGGASGGVTHR